MSSRITFKITFPTEGDFIERECNSKKCGRYFKVAKASLRDRMYCPYCGNIFEKEQLLTGAQLSYAKQQVVEKAKEYVLSECDKMFADVARKVRGPAVRFTHQPIRYKAKSIITTYRQKEVDSELECPNCSVIFQIFGIFGLCPGCRNENQIIYDAHLAILLQDIATSKDPNSRLRHAYTDLISTFETFCRRSASQTFLNTNFQDIFEARRAFKTNKRVDIFAEISEDDMLTLRRIFQKRHAYIHNGGIISEKYIRKIPEDALELNQRAELSLIEFNAGAKALRLVIDQLVNLRLQHSEYGDQTKLSA